MAIAGIRIQGDIRHDRHLRDLLLQLADCTRDQTIFVKALSPVLGFKSFSHLGEKHHATDAQIPGTFHLTSELIKAPATGARHGANRLHSSTFMHKQRINEVCWGKTVFTDHGSQRRRAAQATRAVGEVHQQP